MFFKNILTRNVLAIPLDFCHDPYDLRIRQVSVQTPLMITSRGKAALLFADNTVQCIPSILTIKEHYISKVNSCWRRS